MLDAMTFNAPTYQNTAMHLSIWFKWIDPFIYTIVLGSLTLIQYNCMIQNFAQVLKQVNSLV